MKLFLWIKRKIKYLFGFVYQKQLKFFFPMKLLNEYIDYKWDLPNGYSIRSYSTDIDLEAWANLLNQDGDFGLWTSERVRNEIVLQSVSPDAISLLFYNNELVGCGNVVDCSKRLMKIAMGMWLIIAEKHRGKKNLPLALTYRTLSYFAKVKYGKVIGYTDPSRLTVLFFHLSNGVMPEYDSLSSFFKWWQVKRKLRPLLERAQKRKRATNLDN